jgi:two-component system, NtrC family, sensor kinase
MKSTKKERTGRCRDYPVKSTDVGERDIRETDESNIRLKRTFEGVLEGCQIIGYDWRYKYINEIAAAQGHHSKDELLAHTMMEAYPGIERTDLFFYLEQCMEKRQTYRFDNEFVFPDSARGWFDIIIEPVPQGIMVLSRDITERRQAVEELREKSELLDQIIEEAPNALWISDCEGTIIRMNQALRDLLGVTNDEVIGKYNILKDAQVWEQGLIPLVKSVFEEGRNVNFTIDYYTGRERQVELNRKNHKLLEITMSTITDKDGKVVNTICQHKDITDQRAKEKELVESEAKYRRLFESSYDAILLTEPGGQIFSANPAACRMLGRSPKEICQLGRDGIVDREDPRLSELLEERARVGKAKGELRFIRKDGTKLTGEVSSTVSSDVNGKIQTSMIIRDVSERAKAHAALKQSEEQFRTLVATCPDGIVQVTVEGTIIFASTKAYELFGYPEEKEVIGQSMLKWIAAEGRESIIANMKRTLQQENVSISEYPALKTTGEKFWIETNSSVIKDGQGNPSGLIVIIRDIAERKLAEEALVKERENFRNSFEMLPFGVQIISLTNQIVYANHTILEMWECESVEQLRKVRLDQAFIPESLALLRQLRKRNTSGTPPPVHELTMISGSGQLHDVRVYGKPIVWNGVQCTEFLYEDITEHNKMETGIQKLNDTLKLIRNINQLIVRIDREPELLQKGCEELVSSGYYPLAWIGFIQEGTFDILPVAKAGKSIDYLSSIKVTWDDSARGQGPTGMAISTKRPCITQEVATDSRFEPWREEALKRGFRSSIALPLTIQHRVIGVLHIYSETVDAFHKQEIDLFIELAQDLSLGIEKIRNRAEQAKAEKSLADEAVRRRVLIDQSRDGIVLLDHDGNVYDTNQKFAEMIGYTPEETRRLRVFDWEYQHTPEVTLQMINVVDEKGNHFESKHKRKDGSIYDVEISSNAAMFGGQKLIFCVCRDITERKKAEEELVRRAILLDATTDAILLYDLEGNIIYANDALCQSQGLTRAQIQHMDTLDKRVVSAKGWRERIHGIEQKKNITYELESCDPAGSVRSIEVRIKLVRIGEKELVLSAARDITARKKGEEELRDRERRYRELAESISDVFFAMDKDLRITYWNRASEQLTGIKAENAIGKRYVDIVPDNESVRFLHDTLQRALANGHPQYFVMKYPGEEILTQEIDVYPTPDGISVFARDITEQEKTHQKLVESEGRLRILFEDAPDAYCLYDMNGRFADGNRAAEDLSGYSRYELIGNTFFDMRMISRDEDIEKATALLNRNVHGEATGPDEIRIVRKDGQVRDVEVSTFPTIIEGQQMVLAAIRDITERKKIQENLIITDRLASIGELASGMAHELNNPLTSVIGFADLLLEKDLPSDIKENITYMCREAKRTSEVVKNMMTFARKHPIIKQPVDIDEIVSKVIEMRNYEHRINNIQVIRHLANDLPKINADFFQLQQVILNIIINAEYFMKESHGSGILTVTSEKVDQNIRLSIADNGTGIPEDNLNRIFDPFFTTKPVGKGTGLGLSICYGIVSEHNGHIYAESEPGDGAKFIIELPIIE